MANDNNNGQRSILEVQQEFAETLGYAEEVIWDLLSQEQSEMLMNKLNQLIRDPPELTGNELLGSSDNFADLQKKRAKQIAQNEEARQTIFNAVWEQRKYTSRQSLTSLIYVMVIPNVEDTNRAEEATNFSCHPVFRCRRCLSNESSDNCCNIFVDETGRVYQNWAQYVACNELPAGVMVAPERGLYRLVGGRVRLDKYVTPAGSSSRKVLGYLDTGSAVGGFAAAGISIAGLLALPVAAPIMGAAAVVGLASAGYATARSGAKLVDRSQHEQSINVTNREARSQWLGTVAGIVGLGAAGATQAVTVATNAGKEVGAITQLTVNSMNITSIAMSGTGLANGILDLILKTKDGDDITTMDVLQLSASLVLFTHSVYNFKLASTIINETANSNIAGYRETLSNNQRRTFDKAAKETIRLNGNTRGKLDIIRNVNDIPSKQQFNDMFKINKDLNRAGVRYSFASDGSGIVLNGEVKTTAAELRASVQHNQGANVLGQVTRPIPASHAESGRLNLNAVSSGSRLLGPQPGALTRPEPKTYAAGVLALELSSVVVGGVVFVLENYGRTFFEHVVNAESLETVITGMANNVPPQVFELLMNLARTFIDTMLDDLTTVLRFFISTESVLYRILKHVLDNFSVDDFDGISQHTGDIFNAVRRYFLSLNPNSYSDLLERCKVCNGHFNVCRL